MSCGCVISSVGWYFVESGGGGPLYRECNPDARTGVHNSILNKAKNQHLRRIGWMQEDVAWYAVHASPVAPCHGSPKREVRESFSGVVASVFGE